MFRCSTVSPSCATGTTRGISTCSAHRTASTLRSVSTIALAARCHNLSSKRPALSRPSRIEDPALMSCHYPFCRITALAMPAVAALVLLTPASILPACAQLAESARHATLSDSAKSDGTRSDGVKPPAAQTTGATGAGNGAAAEQANPSQQKSLAAKTIEKVKEVAKSAGGIFSRVPCLPPRGGAKSMGALPQVASKLA